MADYKINTIRDAVSYFRHFMEDASGRLHRQMAYPPKLIYYLITIYNNAISAEDKKVVGSDDISIIVTKPCILFNEIDVVECPCAPASGCTFYKSVDPIPDIIGGKPIAVTTVDGSHSYDYVNWQDFKIKLKSRLLVERVQPYYTIRTINNETYIYLYSSNKISDPKAAALVFVPYDIIEAAYMKSCDDEQPNMCSPLDESFTIKRELIPRIFELTLNSLLNSKRFATGADIFNNDNNDTKVQITKR